jgi:hypothetical protein
MLALACKAEHDVAYPISHTPSTTSQAGAHMSRNFCHAILDSAPHTRDGTECQPCPGVSCHGMISCNGQLSRYPEQSQYANNPEKGGGPRPSDHHQAPSWVLGGFHSTVECYFGQNFSPPRGEGGEARILGREDSTPMYCGDGVSSTCTLRIARPLTGNP